MRLRFLRVWVVWGAGSEGRYFIIRCVMAVSMEGVEEECGGPSLEPGGVDMCFLYGEGVE